MINVISPLVLIITAMIILAYLINRFAKLPNNITVLFLAQPLVSATAPIMIFIGGILSTKMSADASLATLPLSLMVAGTAIATIPIAMLSNKIGRRYATIIGFSGALIGSIVAALAVMNQDFYQFSVAAFLIGISSAAAQQLRFAAIESIDHEKDVNKALSILMFAGIFSALIGPEVAMFGETLFSGSIGFAGVFFGLTAIILIAMIIMLWYKNPQIVLIEDDMPQRPLTSIIKQPLFIVALLAGALSYGMMSFVMTSTPLSMHQLHGHSLVETKWVIQSHIAAMFLPSLITTWLSEKIGIRYILLIGSIMFSLVLLIATQGHSVLHYWWALIILGVAWNFLFFSGTSLLHRTYRANEKHKVQAINDFSIFSFQGASSLLAGWVLYNYGWQGVVRTAIPFVLIMLLSSIYYLKVVKKPKQKSCP